MGITSLISKAAGGSSLLGSMFSAGMGLLGGSMDRANANAQWEREYNSQKEFAQNGIRWKVADAKAAGIHPLAALGAQTASYSPQAVSHTNYASALESMGQNISRAIGAKMTPEERQAANLQREGLELDNEFKRAQIENVRSQTVSRQMEDVAMMARASQTAVNAQGLPPPMPHVTKGKKNVSDTGFGPDIPYLQRVVDPDGNIVAIIPSSDVHDALEDIAFWEQGPYLDVTKRMASGQIYGYYQDPKTKTWKKGKPPFRKVSPVPRRAGGIRGFYGGY